MKYEISNSTSGLVLGTYDGTDEGAALDALARDAGYESYSDACSVSAGRFPLPLTLTLRRVDE